MTATGELSGVQGAGVPEQATTGHRAHLDGLRAVAVYLVVMFHAGVTRMAGGFIGVDVFFVLSGFLVTQVLLRDVAGNGSVRFGRFYARRVRRLLPAALLTLVITAVVYSAVATPAQLSDATSALRAAFLYVANWFFIGRSTSYFASDVDRSPVLHFWSLAVEEQFYLVWPLLLTGLLWTTARFGRRRWTALRVVIGAAAAASAAWALYLRVDQPDRAYFGSDSRAYQLLAGALLALTPGVIAWIGSRRRAVQLLAPIALLSIVGLSLDVVRLDPIERGVAVTIATMVAILTLDSGVESLARRALSGRAVGYLGKVSYGTYLWHWPLIIVILRVRTISPLPLAGIAFLLATGLASLSYQLVELPVRRSPSLDRFRWPVVVGGLAVSVLAGLLVLPRITDAGIKGAPAVAEGAVTAFAPVPASFNQKDVYSERFGQTVDCVGKPPSDCTVVRGHGLHVLLMGDSNAEMWIPAFTRMAKAHDLTLSLAVDPGCLWQRDAYKLSAKIIANCRRTKTDAYERVIPALDPDLIVLVNAREPKSSPNVYIDNKFNRIVRDSTRSSITQLSAGHRQIMIIESAPTPDGDFNPLQCLADAKVVDECRFVASTKPTWVEVEERAIAAKDDLVSSVDFDRLICPFLPICDPMVGDTVVFWNGGHITTRYSESLAGQVGDYLVNRGLIPPS